MYTTESLMVPLGLGPGFLQGVASSKTLTKAMATSGIRVPLVSTMYFEVLSRNSTTEIGDDSRKKKRFKVLHCS